MSRSVRYLVVACSAIVLLVISTGRGHAQGNEWSRLGETVEQCDQHYGTPTNISSIFQGAYKQVTNHERCYKRDGILIGVCFVADREISISYQASSVIFSNEKVAKLIEINKQGRDWTWPVRPENPVSKTENPLSDKCKELYSSDGGQSEVTTYVTASDFSGIPDGTELTILNVWSPEAFKPEYIAENKALFMKHPKPTKKGDINGS